MRKHDARTLDHATLEALRECAVQRVQEGESPKVIARVFWIGRTAIYRWLADYRPGGWGALKAKPIRAETVALRSAIDSGDLARAYSVLAQIEMKQRAALDRLASNAAATVGRRGEVALARLNYLDAAKQFSEAARLLPQTNDLSKQKSKYLDDEAAG